MPADEPAGLVFVGALTADTIVAVPRYPDADERVQADALVRAGGGPAATAAVAAARSGATGVAFVGAVGDDVVGRELCDQLAAEGVDVRGVSVVGGASSGSSVIVVDLARGTRAISTVSGPALQFSAAVRELILAARWVHVDHLGWAPVAEIVPAGRVRSGPALSGDISYPVTGFGPAGLDLYAPNLAAIVGRYPRIAGNGADAHVEALLHAALADGASNVVITRGRDGSSVATSAGRVAHQPGHRVRVLSTLGAGDVFHGALLAAVDRGEDLGDAAEYAGTVAALSCRGLDGRSAIPSDIEARSARNIEARSARKPVSR